MTITFDASLLTAYYQAKAGLNVNTSASSGGGSAATAAKKAPTAPWSTNSTAPKADALVKSVLSGAKFVNEGATKLDVPSANGDYRKLFALYQGINALEGLAEQIQAKGVGDTEKTRLRATFDRGLAEVSAYLDGSPFKDFSVALGAVAAKVQTTVGTPRATDGYQTAPLAQGTLSDPVPAFAGPVAFSMTVKKANSTQQIDFDLSEMGSTPRTMSNVVMYMNDKLLTAGVNTRFANVRIPGQPITTKAGKDTITLGTAPDSFALKVKTDSAETVSFQAPVSAPAVYVGGQSGGVTGSKSNPVQQITKYEAGGTTLAGSAADGKLSTKTLGAEVLGLKQSVTAPDGSVYVLAEVQGGVGGEKLKSTNDLALLKYDSAGNLAYSRSLGAAGAANGYALAVSADGKSVAVGGQVVGKLDAGDIPADAKAADSFVTVYNDQGEEQWTQRAVATGDDRVNALAFAADGSLYATGTTAGNLFGQAAIGSGDGYIRGYSATGKVTFSSPYGTTGGDKGAGIVVDGSSLVVAGIEGGEAVLRRYDLQATGAPVLSSTRNLGGLGGGSIAGITLAADGSLIVAGTTGAALSAGSVTTGYDGAGKAGFVANLAANLSSSGSDRLTYLDSAKDKTLTAFSVSGGKVYVTGQQTITAPPGQTVPSHDGYAAAIDPQTGAISWSTSFKGVDLEAAPTTIAVAQTGASVLDRLGLPTGVIDTTPSDTLVASTGVRAGDQFTIRVGGIAKKITIEATDTLKTLATKINRASQFYATASVVKVDGMDQLKIVPAMKNADIEIEPGKLGADALRALGLAEGVVTNDPTSARDALKVRGSEAAYGLGVSGIANLSTDAAAKQAGSSLLAAATALRNIYTNMVKPPTLADTKPTAAPSAYMSAKIADYQLALARLGG